MSREKQIVKLLENFRNIYKTFDGGHDERHFDEVMDFGLKSEKRWNEAHPDNKLDHDILRVILGAHDIGMCINREEHEKYSNIMVKNNIIIKLLFSKDEIDLICESILTHRSRYIATTQYGEILKDADKCDNFNEVRALYRIAAFNLNKLVQRGVKLDSSFAPKLYEEVERILIEEKVFVRSFNAKCEINKKYNFIDYETFSDKKKIMIMCNKVTEEYLNRYKD